MMNVYVNVSTNWSICTMRVKYMKPGDGFHYHLIWLKFNPKYFRHNSTYFRQTIRNIKSRIYSLPMNLHKHQLYMWEQHRESFNIWLAIIRINTEGKSLIMKLGPWAGVHNHGLTFFKDSPIILNSTYFKVLFLHIQLNFT